RHGLGLIGELIGDAEPDVQKALAWALRSMAAVDLAATTAFLDAEASQAAETNDGHRDRKSTRLNSSHVSISYAVFCLKKKTPCRGPPPGGSPSPHRGSDPAAAARDPDWRSPGPGRVRRRRFDGTTSRPGRAGSSADRPARASAQRGWRRRARGPPPARAPGRGSRRAAVPRPRQDVAGHSGSWR